MNLKKLIALLLAVLMVIGVSACGKGNDQPEAKKDSVVIAIGSEPETLDPTQGWGHGNSPIVQSTLVRYKSDLTFENDLATKYELSPDGLVWTFNIRDDAKFTDGKPVTAEDVAFTPRDRQDRTGLGRPHVHEERRCKGRHDRGDHALEADVHLP